MNDREKRGMWMCDLFFSTTKFTRFYFVWHVAGDIDAVLSLLLMGNHLLPLFTYDFMMDKNHLCDVFAKMTKTAIIMT